MNKPPRKLNLESQEVQDRFWDKVDYRGWDCWKWTASTNSNGIGIFGVAGVSYYVHRVAYMLTRGSIPEGMEVRRICRDPLCCRPLHLYLAPKDCPREEAIKSDNGRYPI